MGHGLVLYMRGLEQWGRVSVVHEGTGAVGHGLVLYMRGLEQWDMG